MSFKEDYDFSIIENTIKDRVIETLEINLSNKEEKICQCEECIIDIVCFALNRLKPNYSASLYGGLYSRANADNRQDDIDEKINEAVSFVSSNASHDIR
ncbi:MAG: late competence development ComFB family protein [Spirochaetaceae bacterium]